MIDIFMPGRFCILGEHSDWASSYRSKNHDIEKGYAIVIGMDKGIHLRAEQSDLFQYEYQDKSISLTKEELLGDIEDDFFEYVISSARIMLERFSVFGIRIICDKVTIPMKKGLSSSAAICMGVIRAFNDIYDLNLPIEEEMELAYIAENSIGSKCGKLDQICAYGVGIRQIEFDEDNISIELIDFYGKCAFIIVDLAGNKDTKRILADLNSHFPYPENEDEVKLYEFLGKCNKEYVSDARRALETCDYNELGRVMTSYQEEFDERVAPFSQELKAPLLHEFFRNIKGEEGVLGYKGVGSQGDGMAQVLVSFDKKDKVLEYIESHLGLDCIMIEMVNV